MEQLTMMEEFTRQFSTALPSGGESVEACARKGACRKCGVTAYGKRKCEQCSRKFCATCAPQSLQKYGEEQWQECCIGCEPYLVVAPAESEPIFELEPESEDIALFSASLNDTSVAQRKGGVGPIHVPLSATFAPVKEDNDGRNLKGRYCRQSGSVSPTSSTSLETDSDSNNEGDEEDGSFFELSRFLSSPPPQQKQQQAPQTPTRERSTRDITIEAPMTPDTMSREIIEAPMTPDSGCCTACHLYAKGKRPCYTCGTKYCSEARCMAYLYDEGTCAKCHPTPRASTTKLDAVRAEIGCCTGCHQYATGKIPCDTCGTKYCQESDCQAFLFSNGTCIACHGDISEL